MQQSAPPVERVRTLVEQFAAAQGRLATTALVLLATLFVGVVAIPFVVRRIHRSVDSRYVSEYVAGTGEAVGEYVPTTTAGIVTWTVQVTMAMIAALALLVVWGQFDVAVAAGTFLLSVPYLWSGVKSVLFVLVGLVAFDQLRDLVDLLSDRSEHMTEHQQEILLRVGQLTIFVTVGVGLLGVWTENLSGLFVGAGFLGIVVGFAARQTLGSLVAGLVLMFSRPFTIGDWVRIGDNEGVVTDITMFNTRLENFDGEFVVIPNDRVGDSSITNRSRKGLLRLRTDVGIDYGSDPDRAMEVATDAMADLDEVAKTPPPQVIPKQFGDSAVVIELRYWIDHPTPPRRWAAVSAVVRAVKSAFDDHGIEVPFPQRELSAREGTTVDADPDGLAGESVAESENGQAAQSHAGDSDAES